MIHLKQCGIKKLALFLFLVISLPNVFAATCTSQENITVSNASCYIPYNFIVAVNNSNTTDAKQITLDQTNTSLTGYRNITLIIPLDASQQANITINSSLSSGIWTIGIALDINDTESYTWQLPAYWHANGSQCSFTTSWTGQTNITNYTDCDAEFLNMNYTDAAYYTITTNQSSSGIDYMPYAIVAAVMAGGGLLVFRKLTTRS